TTIPCAECGVEFCLPNNLVNKLRETRRTFYCPNGHALSYKRSTVDELRDEIARLKTHVKWRDAAITDLKVRVAALEGSLKAYRMNYGRARKRGDNLLDQYNQLLEERNELVMQAKGWGPS